MIDPSRPVADHFAAWSHMEDTTNAVSIASIFAAHDEPTFNTGPTAGSPYATVVSPDGTVEIVTYSVLSSAGDSSQVRLTFRDNSTRDVTVTEPAPPKPKEEAPPATGTTTALGAVQNVLNPTGDTGPSLPSFDGLSVLLLLVVAVVAAVVVHRKKGTPKP